MGEDRHDFRMPTVGAAAWLAGIAAYHGGTPALLALSATALVLLGVSARVDLTASQRRLVLAASVVALAVAASTVVRHQGVASGPLGEMAQTRTQVVLRATPVADPYVIGGEWGDRAVVRLRVHEVAAADERYRLGASVVLLGGAEWREVELGEQIRVRGRLRPADGPDTAAVVTARGGPVRIRAPASWWQGAEAVRSALRASVAPLPPERRGLVPALVVGDVTAMQPELEDDFRTTGLTHLTAVSGTNLTLLLGFVLLLARSAGVRGRWLYAVALVGIVGFILLTRTEPSVLRAAAMGVVGLFALGTDGRRRGLRALGVAVTGLLLVWPPLAVSIGFALSVLATAGIVVAGPPISRGLARTLPMPLAQAVAVPLAAQVAVTPVIAGISGEVSLVAVLANVVVAPAVGPATVLGLAGGLLGLAWLPLGQACGWAAGWCVAWIVTVAEWGAQLPRASVGWGTGPVAITGLVGLCVVLLVLAPRWARRPRMAAAVALLLVLVVVDVPGRVTSLVDDWPPRGWRIVACDVGQGDAVVLRTADDAGVVVDVGPDPAVVAACLERLGVEHVPLVVLSHFHADHVDGLTGVLDGPRVDAIAVSPLPEPARAASVVERLAAEHDTQIGVAPYGAVRRYGATTVQVVGPTDPAVGANDASVVLLADVAGVRVLLTGDIEPPAQARLAAALPGLEVDVLKVPHHASGHQDEDWLEDLSADIALVSVGAENDYGHPSGEVVQLFERDGAVVGRTDHDGDLAVVVRDGTLELISRG